MALKTYIRRSDSSGLSSSGARGMVAGRVSTGAKWHEDITLSDDGAAIASADTIDWQFNFRKDESDTSSDLSLTSDAGTLAISQGATSTTIQIRVPYTSLSSMDGDYFADLASNDGSGRIIHWLSGKVTFTRNTVWF